MDYSAYIYTTMPIYGYAYMHRDNPIIAHIKGEWHVQPSIPSRHVADPSVHAPSVQLYKSPISQLFNAALVQTIASLIYLEVRN